MAKATKATQGKAITDAKPSSPNLVFSRGWIGQRDLVWVLAQDDPAAGGTRVLQYKGGKWVHRNVGWGGVAVTAVTKPSVEVIVVGADGQILRGVPTGFSEEHVDPSKSGPEFNGQIRDARFIGSKVVAVGMSRQAYRREQAGQWVHIDQGMAAKPSEMVGLNGVDGFGPNDLYAVGLKGEIWHYDGKAWYQQESPTNIVLHRLRCVAGKRVAYACGAAGTVLRGTIDGFEPIAQESASDNLYGLEWFGGKLYLAGLKTLYVLDGDALEPVDVGLGAGVTFGDLHANDGVMWSVGARHLIYTEDGTTWTQVFHA